MGDAPVGVELPSTIERTFPARATRDGRFIGGLSMGGYGALRIALGYPDRFASAHSHSGAMLGPRRRSNVPPTAEYRAIVGPHSGMAGSANDLALLAARAKTAGLLPRLRIDCGIDDGLIDDSRTFNRQLVEASIDHEYQEFPGGQIVPPAKCGGCPDGVWSG